MALEVRPKVLQAKCQMTTKSPKRNCKDCKLGLIDCEKHMQTCGNCAFSACNFCMRFCCGRGDCARKICCAGVAKHQAEIHVMASASSVKLTTAARCEVVSTTSDVLLSGATNVIGTIARAVPAVMSQSSASNAKLSLAARTAVPAVHVRGSVLSAARSAVPAVAARCSYAIYLAHSSRLG